MENIRIELVYMSGEVENGRVTYSFPKQEIVENPSLSRVFLHAFHLFRTHREALEKTKKAVDDIPYYGFYFNEPRYRAEVLSVYVYIGDEIMYIIEHEDGKITVDFRLDFVNLIHALYYVKQDRFDIKDAKGRVEEYAVELEKTIAPIEEDEDGYADDPQKAFIVFEDSEDMKAERIAVKYWNYYNSHVYDLVNVKEPN